MGFKSNGIRWTWDESTTPCTNWYTTTTNIDEPVINMKDTISDSELEEVTKKLKDSKLTVEAVPPVKPPMQYGWVCPKCGRVNAPWVSSCACVAPKWEITY